MSAAAEPLGMSSRMSQASWSVKTYAPSRRLLAPAAAPAWHPSSPLAEPDQRPDLAAQLDGLVLG